MNQLSNLTTAGPEWTGLYRAGGIAALLAGLLFRRNLAVEVGTFSGQVLPDSVGDWFVFLQRDRLLGLTFLHVFDVLNYVLVGLMFLALYAALRHADRSTMAVAALAAFAGIVVYFASNTAFSMLSLSDRYAAATGEAERNGLLAAGQSLLALNRFSSGAQPGSGGYLSLFLLAIASLLAARVMLRSGLFHRVTAYAGILAGALDLAYCLAYLFVPTADSGGLAVLFIPAAGFFLMIWHILVGWRLFRLGKPQ